MLRAVNARAKKPQADEPPYTRYAFLNPYNLSLLAGAGVAAAASGQWWIGVCAVAAEGLWMLFAPDSKVLRKLWFDKIWADSQKAAEEERLNQKFAQLSRNDQMRAFALREQKARIFQLAIDNPSLTVDLMKDELDKIDKLLEDFLDLAAVCARCETHVQSFDLNALNASYALYQQQAQYYRPTDKRRSVAEKNLEVLTQRRKRYEDLLRSLEMARGQMDLMENTFRLLADEIVTMADPSELGARLEELRVGVAAIRETTAEPEEAYDELEEIEQTDPGMQKRR
jgi:hypothetical protein